MKKAVHTEDLSERHGVGTKLKDASQPTLNEAESEELRALVSQAVEVIPPNWPLRTFAYRNPLIGFEHLPFHEAVSQAKHVLGGEGYLSTAEYRACYAEGRISEKELLSALRSRVPELAAQDTVRAGERSLHPEEILLVHFVHGIDPLDPKLWSWQLSEEDATHRIRPDVPQAIKDRLRSHGPGGDSEAVYVHALWSGALKALGLSEDGSTGNHGHSPTTAKAGGSAHAEHGPTQQRIRTAAETLDLIDGDDEPELRARLRTIIKGNVARLEELVRDLLDLSRLESPEFRPRFSLVHMAEVEAMIHEVYHDALGQRGLRIVFEAGPQVETLRSDRSLLHLVIKNLVDNSIKFARDNSGIVVRSYRKDASVIIEVIDEGIGIPLAHQERIFERFYQVDSARSPSAPHRGSGLGLAIVKHALRALGGDVTVRSIWGQGTTMTVELRDAAVADPTIDIPAQ